MGEKQRMEIGGKTGREKQRKREDGKWMNVAVDKMEESEQERGLIGLI